jgi:integrase
MNPAQDVSRIQRASARIHNAAKPVRELVARLQPAAEVEKLGLDMMHAADHDRFRTASERAVLYRDGLLIAFLVHRPLRLANLASIAVGGQLQRRGAGWWLSFDGAEVKGGRDIDCTWPEDLVPALEQYLEVHRPVLLAGAPGTLPAADGLWVALGGRPMGKSAIEFQIRSRTGEEFGKPIFPHAFRHLAATTIATVDPENVQAASAVLSHASARTTEDHYNRAKMVDAGRRYHEALGQQRGRRKGSR